MSAGKPKRYFRNFLHDKRFQLKYTLAVVVITATLAFILGWFLYKTQQEVFDAARENSQLAALDAMGDPEMEKSIQDKLEKEDSKIKAQNASLMLTLVLSLGGLVALLTLLGIVATHKIAGPAYAMRRILKQIADGKHPEVRALRKGDELVAVASELKRMADSLREREEQDVTGLKEARDKLQAVAGVPVEVTEWIDKVIVEKEQRLSTD